MKTTFDFRHLRRDYGIVETFVCLFISSTIINERRHLSSSFFFFFAAVRNYLCTLRRTFADKLLLAILIILPGRK